MTQSWELLQSFVRVADAGSLTGAAKVLGLSQPTMSRHVAELEEELGMQLFVRHARGLALTDRGAELLVHARDVDHRVEEVFRRAGGLREKPSGVVRVSAGEPLGVLTLPAAFAKLRTDYPDIEIELVVDNLPSNLSRREADIAVRMFEPTQPDLVPRHVGTVPVGFYAARSYVRRHGAPRSLEELGEHALIGFDRDPNFARAIADFGRSQSDFVFRTDHVIAQLEAIRGGVGIGALHLRLGDADRRLVRVLPDFDLPPLSCWIVMHRDVRDSPAVRVVLEALTEALRTYIEGS